MSLLPLLKKKSASIASMLKQFLQEFNLLQLKVVKSQEISRTRLGKDKVMN